MSADCFVVAVDPQTVLVRQRYGTWRTFMYRIFASVDNAKAQKRRNPQFESHIRLFELTFDPHDPTPNALKITSEIE